MKKYEILKNLVRFNTIEDKENKEIMDYIESYLLKLNFKTESKGKNLIMSIGENPKLGFLGHTDTVEYIEGWDNSPFELTKKENKLYGLGVADMKGGIAAMLDAVAQIDFSKMKYGMKLYFTYDEELYFKGIEELVTSNEKFPEMMIFGEPTDNEMLVGEKGLLEYELDFKGIKVHSSNPEKGKSATMNAVKFLFELDEFYNKKIRPKIQEEFDIPYTTMNVGIINGGSAMNSVAAQCNVIMDFRIASKEHVQIIKEKVTELSEKYDCDVNIGIERKMFIDENNLVKEIKTANFITEACLVEGTKRMILGVGPVTAHEVNEHITEESYEKLIEQYKELIYKICEEKK